MRLKSQTYALTAITHQGRHIFQRDAIAELFIAKLFEYRDTGKFQLHGFALAPNHVFIVLTPAPYIAIECCDQLIKGRFSLTVRKEFEGFKGKVWQNTPNARSITGADDLRNKLLYIHNNPIYKHLEAYPHIHASAAYASRLDPSPHNLAS
jgi:REP element-mobilizing transposase RayT